MLFRIGVVPLGGSQGNAYIKAATLNDVHVLAQAHNLEKTVKERRAVICKADGSDPVDLSKHPLVAICKNSKDLSEGIRFVLNAVPARAVDVVNSELPADTKLLEVQNGIRLNAPPPGLNPQFGISTIGTANAPVGTSYTHGKLIVGADNPFLEDIIAAFGKQEVFSLEVTANIHGAKWKKIAQNCALNVLATIFGIKLAVYLERVMSDPRHAKLIGGIAKEVCDVAAAHGVQVEPADKVVDSIIDLMKKLPQHPTSTQEAFLRGLPLDIDVLNRGVASVGARLAVPTPLNDFIAKKMAEYEAVRNEHGASLDFHLRHKELVERSTEEILAFADKHY